MCTSSPAGTHEAGVVGSEADFFTQDHCGRLPVGLQANFDRFAQDDVTVRSVGDGQLEVNGSPGRNGLLIGRWSRYTIGNIVTGLEQLDLGPECVYGDQLSAAATPLSQIVPTNRRGWGCRGLRRVSSLSGEVMIGSPLESLPRRAGPPTTVRIENRIPNSRLECFARAVTIPSVPSMGHLFHALDVSRMRM